MNKEESSKLKLSDLLKKNYIKDLFEDSKAQKITPRVLDPVQEIKPSDTIPPEPRPEKPRDEVDREGDPCDDIIGCEQLEDLMEACNRGEAPDGLGGFINKALCDREACDEPLLECVDMQGDQR